MQLKLMVDGEVVASFQGQQHQIIGFQAVVFQSMSDAADRYNSERRASAELALQGLEKKRDLTINTLLEGQASLGQASEQPEGQ